MITFKQFLNEVNDASRYAKLSNKTHNVAAKAGNRLSKTSSKIHRMQNKKSSAPSYKKDYYRSKENDLQQNKDDILNRSNQTQTDLISKRSTLQKKLIFDRNDKRLKAQQAARKKLQVASIKRSHDLAKQKQRLSKVATLR